MTREEDKFIRILETEDWVVDYDKENDRYRAAWFVGLNFVDEVWFDAYKEKETSLSEVLNKLELIECKLSEEEVQEIMGCMDFYKNREK